jgi:hypothetical protein
MRPSAGKPRIHASLTGQKISTADSQLPLVCAAVIITISTYVIASGVTAGHNLIGLVPWLHVM